MRESPEPGALESMRLDLWLDVSCLFKTRSEAQKACALGRMTVNAQPAKAHRLIRIGDEIEIARPHGRTQRIIVLGLVERHVAKADARRLYDDKTPKPTPEEVEMRRVERIYRAAAQAAGTPGKRDRKALRALKGKS